MGNAVSVPVVEWVAKRIKCELESDATPFVSDHVKAYVPEFAKEIWKSGVFTDVDYTDISMTHKWPKAGLA